MKKQTKTTLAAIAGLALSVSAHATVIFVVDAPDSVTTRSYETTVPYGGNPVSATFDLSTGGDSAAGLSGTLVSNSTGYWHETGGLTASFNDDYMGDMNKVGETATWTVTGYAPGATVSVYGTWRAPGAGATSAPYSINGGSAIPISHQGGPTNDLVLNDPAGGTQGFELIGTGTADGSGQVQVVLTTGTGGALWTPVDALAFSSAAVPEPSTTALLGLGGLALILRRRK